MKLHLDENFDNVQVEVQAVADPVFVAANEEHDENKEKYEAAMEANEEATEGLTPEEGESIEVEKREVLKQMHLEESLFSEPTPFDIRNRIEFMNSIDEIRDYCNQYPEIDYEFTDKEIRIYLDDNFVTSKYLDELYESLNEEVEDKIELTDEQKERAYQALEMAEIVDNDIDENGNHIYDKGDLMSQDWFLVKRTEGDVKDYPYTLIVNDWAWDDVTEHGFNEIIRELKEDFKKGDKFKNQNGAIIEILDADDRDVTYKITSDKDKFGDFSCTSPESVETVIRMNGYKKISESMEEIDRQVFGSLNKETREPGVYYVLVDQNFDHKIYADSDEEAIEKFRAQLNEEYDSRIGGDTEDFAADLNDIRNALKDIKLATPRAEECMSDILDSIEFYENNYLDPDDIQDLKRFRESIANKYNTNQAKDINVDNIDIYIRKLCGDKNLNGLTKSDREHIASYLAELRDEIKSTKSIDESLETSDFEERKENARLMHEVMMAMNDEDAYFDWIYTMPDEPDEDDFEWFAEDDEEYKELVDAFNRIMKRYGKDGLFDPSDEVVEFTKSNGFELEITRPEIEEEYDPDLGGDTEDYKLDVESIKKALSGLEFGTLRAEGLVDEFIETLEDWMPMDESINRCHKKRRSLKESIKAEDYPDEWEEAKEIIDNLDCYVADVDKSGLKDGYVSILMKDKNSNFSAWVDCHRDKYGDVTGEWNQYIFYLRNSKDIIQSLVQDSEEAGEQCLDGAVYEAEEILSNEGLNESAKAFSSLELEVMDILRRNGYKIYPTDIEAYADYIKMIRKETGEDYSVAQWFKDTEAMSKEESGLEEVDDDLEESLIYNVAKEQLKRFTEGKMGDSWDPKTYLERLESKKYLNEEQIKKLTESVASEDIAHWLDNHYGEEDWKNKFNNYLDRLKNSSYRVTSKDVEKAVKTICKDKKLNYEKVSNGLNIKLEENFHVVDLEDGDSFGDYDDVEYAKAKAVQYTSMFNAKAAVVDDDNNVIDGFDSKGRSLKK